MKRTLIGIAGAALTVSVAVTLWQFGGGPEVDRATFAGILERTVEQSLRGELDVEIRFVEYDFDADVSAAREKVARDIGLGEARDELRRLLEGNAGTNKSRPPRPTSKDSALSTNAGSQPARASPSRKDISSSPSATRSTRTTTPSNSRSPIPSSRASASQSASTSPLAPSTTP